MAVAMKKVFLALRVMVSLRASDVRKHHRPNKGGGTAYDDIYRETCDLIKIRADRGGDSLVYAVPSFLPGKPSFEATEVRRRLIRSLRDGGFRVAAEGSSLIICWGEEQRPPPPPPPSPPLEIPRIRKKLPASFAFTPQLASRLLPNVGPRVQHPTPHANTRREEESVSERLARLRAALGGR